MDSRLYKLLWFGVSTAIIGAMVYFADISRFINALRTAETVYLVPAFVFGLSVFLVWSYVWYSFFQQMALSINYVKAVKIFMAGNFMNSITPIGQFGGEPVMAYLVSKNTEASYEKAFSTVFSADIVNAVPFFTFLMGGAAYLLVFGSLKEIVLQTIFMALLATVVGGSIVYLLWFEAGKIEGAVLSFLEWLSGKIGRGQAVVELAEEKLQRVEESFQTIGESPGHLLNVAVIAHLGFLLQLGCLYFILLSLGMEVDFTPLYFVLTVVSLGNFSPTPGGSGTFEALMAWLLTVFVPGMTFASALVAAIIFRLTTYWPGLAIGYVSLNMLGNGVEG
ncbi:MAG: lysylphosphatidylglycerol synthase transmembrane domain-containing protein [Candidatus Nanohaloarchaea archaeon]